VIRDSYQRCVNIHATNSVLTRDNVAYETAGHWCAPLGSAVGRDRGQHRSRARDARLPRPFRA
jgi:hypothetical protein